ncbi:MAG: S-adenosylmethionine:tRNA ribosyltransferase-isomerase [Bacteroidia bacterium]|nr:S-adenosylmethionine:tRNA ribosyltransferase-isomerase [Bacteroidia bacterium]MDW8133496.1 S-adenosylmethionine:tRNA ribosyltransferase-isomerase [Bacteroidia bacterium]
MLWSYELPPDRIAQYPIEPRHAARLLIYKGGEIEESIFLHLAEFLPRDTRLFYNDSRVIPARLRKGNIEVLLTEVVEGGWDRGSPQLWKGLFRPGRFWRKGGEASWEQEGLSLYILWEKVANPREGYFKAIWKPSHLSALEVLERFGMPPLPPYIKRSVEAADKERYQTLHAIHPGSIAAPTAGLHFTPDVWQRLREKGIQSFPITLHVGLGTFLPLQNPEMPEKHPIHAEFFSISAASLSSLITDETPIVCVGTTTLRALESLYWFGVNALQGKFSSHLPPFPWKEEYPPAPLREALQALVPFTATTQLYILPGYPFQVASGLITNFHLPQSTLLALVEAFIGREGIVKVYNYALEKGFRFLSYGDTSLLWRK